VSGIAHHGRLNVYEKQRERAMVARNRAIKVFISNLTFPNFVIFHRKKQENTAYSLYDNNSVWVCFSASMICGIICDTHFFFRLSSHASVMLTFICGQTFLAL
jgi:hypothetical protein